MYAKREKLFPADRKTHLIKPFASVGFFYQLEIFNFVWLRFAGNVQSRCKIWLAILFGILIWLGDFSVFAQQSTKHGIISGNHCSVYNTILSSRFEPLSIIDLYVTRKCNFECDYCFVEAKDKVIDQ